jgi:hypothetical protein
LLNIIGDSHVHTFTKCDNTRIWEISPEVSIKTIREYPTVILKALNTYPNEVWAFQIGERDVRNNILAESITQNVPIDQIIEEYVASYRKFMFLLEGTYDIYIMTTPPQGIFCEEVDEFFSPREVRHNIGIKLNSGIKKAFTKPSKILDLWHMGALPKDMVNKEYFQKDGLHIKPALAETALRHALKNL